MMRPRIQHYVPQFLLRGFTNEHGSLSVFDKANQRRFESGTRAVAAESFFYDAEVGRLVVTAEPGLAELEGEAARVVANICREASLASLAAEDRAVLAVFIAIQSLRTRHTRENWEHLGKLLVDRVNRVVPEDRPDAKIEAPTAEDVKLMTMMMMGEPAEEIAQIIAQKPWVLAHAPNADLYIGDNPVAMHNDRSFGFYGNIGFAVPGVEIHFPISAEYTLFVPCPTSVANWRKTVSDAERLRGLAEAAARARLDAGLAPVQSLLEAVDLGSALDLRPENVERENSLQVGYAGRWVFSRTDNFDLATRMLGDDDRYRSGPFGTVV